MNYFPVYIILVFLLGLSSCEKSYPDILNEVEFDCSEVVQVDFFFEGDIDGELFCIYNGHDGYEMGIWQSAGYLTNSPSITPGDTSSSVIRTGTWATWYFYRQPMEHLKPYLQIESPVFEAGTDLTTIVLESLKEGPLPLRSNEVGPNEGFNVNLLIPHYENKTKPSNPYIFTASLASMQAGKGNQENSFFEVTELELLQSGPRLFFTVTFEFSCELYYQGNPSKHYKRLDNGVFRIGFELNK